MNIQNVKLIVSEIDGVITNSHFTEDELGNVLYKTFNYKDFDAINHIKSLNYKFVFLSDDNKINYNMCRRRHIPFYWAKTADEKVTKLGELSRRYGATPDQVIYIPSKLSDEKCVQMIAKTICPIDVVGFIRNKCESEFTKCGGEGVLSDLLDLLTGNIIIQDF